MILIMMFENSDLILTNPKDPEVYVRDFLKLIFNCLFLVQSAFLIFHTLGINLAFGDVQVSFEAVCRSEQLELAPCPSYIPALEIIKRSRMRFGDGES